MDFPMGFPKNWWWVAIFSILFPHDLCPLQMSGKIVGSSAVDAEEADLWSAGGLARPAINQLGMVPPKNMVVLGMVYEIGFTLSI